jgi:hypothetical protein
MICQRVRADLSVIKVKIERDGKFVSIRNVGRLWWGVADLKAP